MIIFEKKIVLVIHICSPIDLTGRIVFNFKGLFCVQYCTDNCHMVRNHLNTIHRKCAFESFVKFDPQYLPCIKWYVFNIKMICHMQLLILQRQYQLYTICNNIIFHSDAHIEYLHFNSNTSILTVVHISVPSFHFHARHLISSITHTNELHCRNVHRFTIKANGRVIQKVRMNIVAGVAKEVDCTFAERPVAWKVFVVRASKRI